MARGTNFYGPADISCQGIPTDDASIPRPSPHASVGHCGRCEAAFALGGGGVMPRPKYLARSGVSGFQTISGGVVENAIYHDGTRTLETTGATDQTLAHELLRDGKLGA